MHMHGHVAIQPSHEPHHQLTTVRCCAIFLAAMQKPSSLNHEPYLGAYGNMPTDRLCNEPTNMRNIISSSTVVAPSTLQLLHLQPDSQVICEHTRIAVYLHNDVIGPTALCPRSCPPCSCRA